MAPSHSTGYDVGSTDRRTIVPLRLYANSVSPFLGKVRITLYEKGVDTSLEYLGQPVPDGCARSRSWLARVTSRPSVRRDAERALAAFEKTAANPDPFFRSDRIHCRGERVEWAVRLGLGAWLVREVEAGRAYLSPPPDDPPATVR